MLELLAAEGGSPVDPKLVPALTSIVVFVLFFLILRRAVWPKIIRGLDEREQKMLRDIEDREEALRAARTAQEEQRAKLAEAANEAGRIINEAKGDARVTADKLIARTQEQIEEMRRRATGEIEAAKQAAIGDLHQETAMLAAAIAAKILQREVSVEDQQRLVDESLRELGRVNNN